MPTEQSSLPLVADVKASTGSRGADDWLVDKPLPPHRDPLILREQVLLQLRCIIDPDLYRDIVSLGFVKELQIDWDAKKVSFTLELTTPACPVKEQFVEEATRLIKELGWVDTVDIKLSSRKMAAKSGPVALNGVSSILAVASCKGGVGKSSIACNLAYMLQSLGARVGLVDADVYGPSLPALIPLEGQSIMFGGKETKTKPSVQYEGSPRTEQKQASSGNTMDEGGLIPLVHDGVKLMSYGYFKASKNYAAVRGPIASNLVSQMIGKTLWGELDYLIIDLPPGTGDIHLTIAQTFAVTGAVMITTPQQLSLVDVEKGIAMFNELKIPTIAVVENMSLFVCPNCDTTHNIFHYGEPFDNVQRLLDQFGIIIRASLPIHPDLARTRFQNANGQDVFPFARAFNEQHVAWKALKTLSEHVIRELSAMKFSPDRVPDLRMLGDGTLEMTIRHPLPRELNGTSNISRVVLTMFSEHQSLGSETVLLANSRMIRMSCRCAECVDEFTGKQKLNPRKIPADVHIKNMKQSGNYAVAIDCLGNIVPRTNSTIWHFRRQMS